MVVRSSDHILQHILRDKSSVWPVFYFFIFLLLLCSCCALWHMQWRTLNIETEKSEQTVFAQISLSVLRFFTVCAMKHLKDCYTKLDHAELLSFKYIPV